MNKEVIIKMLLEHPELVTKETIAFMADKYKQPAYAVVSYLFDIYKDIVNNEEYFEYGARVKKKAFDAYVAVGFSEEQAMALLLNDNLQLAKQMTSITNNMKNIEINK